jgi:hypothetical protein
VHGSRDGDCSPLYDRLPPPRDAFIRVDPKELPVRSNLEQFEAGDAHG